MRRGNSIGLVYAIDYGGVPKLLVHLGKPALTKMDEFILQMSLCIEDIFECANADVSPKRECDNMYGQNLYDSSNSMQLTHPASLDVLVTTAPI